MPKSIIINKHGGPEVLELKDVEVGEPGPKEIKIKNKAIGINFIDTALAWQCLKRGAAWPLQANREGKNGELREKDNNVSLNGPRG